MSVTTLRFLVITLESSISENHKAGVDKVHAGALYLSGFEKELTFAFSFQPKE